MKKLSSLQLRILECLANKNHLTTKALAEKLEIRGSCLSSPLSVLWKKDYIMFYAEELYGPRIHDITKDGRDYLKKYTLGKQALRTKEIHRASLLNNALSGDVDLAGDKIAAKTLQGAFSTAYAPPEMLLKNIKKETTDVYTYDLCLYNPVAATDRVRIHFKDEKFNFVVLPFLILGPIYTREQWKILGAIAQEITRIEEEIGHD